MLASPLHQTGGSMVEVRLEGVSKRFGLTVAVDGVSFEVKSGELFTLLGPSGCGKTTLLRIIAGLEFPDKGRVYFNGRDITGKKTYERGTALVFQNYALWPHMNVFENVAFGLKIRNFPKDEIKRKVNDVLEMVRLKGLEKRFPGQLSGGQQQRVALARALVVEPLALLLDEPLSNLDAKLRIEMREEIRKIVKTIGITSIYVTHDQEEAMSISDRVAVMNAGRIMQVGTPQEVYEKPRNVFVAWFIGRSNVLKGYVKKLSRAVAYVDVGGNMLIGSIDSSIKLDAGEEVALIIRPEDFVTSPLSTNYNKIEGEVDSVMFMGGHFHIYLVSGSMRLLARIKSGESLNIGSSVRLYVPFEKTKVLPWEEIS